MPAADLRAEYVHAHTVGLQAIGRVGNSAQYACPASVSAYSVKMRPAFVRAQRAPISP